MGSTIIDQGFPYDIVHRGSGDVRRHNKRVNEAVRKQLKDIIGQQDIITREGNKKVKIRLKHLEQYRFVHSRERIDSVGRDQFDELVPGEIISKPSKGSGDGAKAGNKPGEEIYEVEFTLDELTDMMIEELNLPDLDERKKNEITSEKLEWTSLRKSAGIASAINKKKTILANILRRRKGKPIPFIKDDLRFNTWEIKEERHSNAVVFLLMDRSGSMWEDKIYAVKAFYFWVVQFLRRRYDKIELKFIAHDYDAKELTEKEFFTISDSGGTRVSSAYQLCHDMIKYNYPSNLWNIYCFHASDGDSWGDQTECLELVADIIKLGAKLFAYTEINIDSYRDEPSELMNMFVEAAERESGILVSVIEEISDVLPALRRFLHHSTRSELENV